ncbi:TPA: phage tail protein [Acinetobacter baumannii]|nr:phage tail protein [Acinetobacter baumannii]
MATYKGILTNNGKALIAGATVSNKINYSHIAVGDGNGSVPVPSETRTALINEKARIALNVVEINPNNTNQIVCEAIIPSNVGGFYIRELGLYAGNTMVVNASYPPTYKPLADEGGAREINIKLVINIQNAEVIALYLDDSLIYATREWVNKNYIRRNEIVDNLTTDDPATPLSAKQGKNLQDNKLDNTATAVAAKKLEIERTSFSNDDDFIKYLADKPTSFFDNETGKYFAQFSVGFVSTLKAGGTFIIGNDVVTGKTKIISCVVRDDGKIDLLNKKELAYTDSSISGNAASATRLQNARRINNVLFDGLQDISIEAPVRFNGTISNLQQLDQALLDGKYTVTELNVAGLYGYGFLVVIRSGGVCHQIYYPHQAQGTNNGTMAMRQSWNANGDSATWSEWRVVGTRDDSKLPLTGGTVTGDLRVNGITYVNKIRSNSDIWFTDETEQYGQRVLTGGLLVSSTFSLSNLVPVNGIYSQGDIRTAGKLVAAQLEGNAATASKLATARTVSFSGAATGAFNYDGSSNSTCILTLANSGVVAGTYASTIQIPSITVNDKGQITGISQQNIRAASTNQSGVVQLADDLQTDDANKALTAKQGKALQDNKLDKNATAVAADKLEIEWTGFTSDQEFIHHYSNKSTAFFDNGQGKFFPQYSVGLVSSLFTGGTFIIASDPVSGKTRVMTCVVRDDGKIDFLNKKELAYTDSNITGNAATATKLQIARNIGLTGAVSGSANFDGAGNITINTTSNNAIGIGQTWQDVKANRSLETTYLNSTGRPIQLCLTFPDTNGATIIIEVIVDGNSVFKHTYDAGTNYGSGFYSFIVPAGSTYKISANTSAIQPSYWSELR